MDALLRLEKEYREAVAINPLSYRSTMLLSQIRNLEAKGLKSVVEDEVSNNG